MRLTRHQIPLRSGAVLLAVLGVAGRAVLLRPTQRSAGPPPSAAERSRGADSPQPSSATGQAHSALDYAEYRSRIEPIFVEKRQGGIRCYDCHSKITTRLKLEPLSQGESSWSDEQSRRNFAAVSTLVTPSDPLHSRLLLHALAQEAGGDPSHSGGKFWTSQNDPEWRMIAAWIRKAIPASSKPAPHTETAALSFQFFRTRVEPVLLKNRPGHARCYGCHILSNRTFHLETLLPGNTSWSQEQSQQNFQSALKQVVPGKPRSSRLLLHPLAPEAGGDPFHSGGRQFDSQNDPDWVTFADWVRALKADESDPPSAASTRVYVTNSAADTIDVIDPVTNQIVQIISGVELPHGIAFSPDGKRIYVSSEAEDVLFVLDRETGRVQKKVPLSARPNNIAITKDGSLVVVGIRSAPGALDLIDTNSLTRNRTVPLHAPVHNVYVTPDSKYAVAGSIEGKSATVVDLSSGQPAWQLTFESGVRPMAFETAADGSTRRVFVQLSGFHGFAVVDFAKRAETARITLPDEPTGFGLAEGRRGVPSHGIGVAPDGKSLWVNSTLANAVFEYSLPDLKLIGHAELPEVHPLEGRPTGAVPEWMTFTPDGKVVYISDSAARLVSAIDTETLVAIAHIPVGEVPKRISTLVLRGER